MLVKKYRDGVELPEKRPCWDYRAVNARIVSDAHPLPLLKKGEVDWEVNLIE